MTGRERGDGKRAASAPLSTSPGPCGASSCVASSSTRFPGEGASATTPSSIAIRLGPLGRGPVGQRLRQEMAVGHVPSAYRDRAAQVLDRLRPRHPGRQDRDLRRLEVEPAEHPISSPVLEVRIDRDERPGVVADFLGGAGPDRLDLPGGERPLPPRDGRPEKRRRRVAIGADDRGHLARGFPVHRRDVARLSASFQDVDRFLGDPPGLLVDGAPGVRVLSRVGPLEIGLAPASSALPRCRAPARPGRIRQTASAISREFATAPTLPSCRRP